MVIRVAKGAISATLRKGSADLVNYKLIQIDLDELLRVVFNIGSHTCCRCCGSGRPKCLLTAALVFAEGAKTKKNVFFTVQASTKTVCSFHLLAPAWKIFC